MLRELCYQINTVRKKGLLRNSALNGSLISLSKNVYHHFCFLWTHPEIQAQTESDSFIDFVWIASSH